MKIFGFELFKKKSPIVNTVVDGMETCMLCGDKTVVQANTPVDYRAYYIEGAGQLCHYCYEKVYGGEVKLTYTEYGDS
jgi:hypothetical protein